MLAPLEHALDVAAVDLVAPQRTSGTRLRILHVVEATFAGTGRHVLDQTRGMLAWGHEVHLIYSPVRMEQHFAQELASLPGLRSCAVPMQQAPSPSDLAAVLAVRRYLRRHGPFDVVHGHSSKGGAVARLAAIGLGAARFYTAHAFKSMDPALGRPARRLYGTIEAFLGRAATDAVIAVSPEEERHAAKLGIPRDRCRCILNAVERPARLPDRATARAMFGLGDDEFCLLFVGRLAPQKAPERFVELVRALAPSVPGLRGLMLGYGPLEPSVRRRIETAGLASHLRLHTERRGWDGMAAADLLVVTSDYEGMPYILLEAASMGLPIVTTDVGGARLVVVPGENGLIVPPGDPAALEAAVRAVVRDRQRFARSRAPSWTPADMVAATLGLYREHCRSRVA